MTDELVPVEEQVAGFKRAIEAVVLVSHDPVLIDALTESALALPTPLG